MPITQVSGLSSLVGDDDKVNKKLKDKLYQSLTDQADFGGYETSVARTFSESFKLGVKDNVIGDAVEYGVRKYHKSQGSAMTKDEWKKSQWHREEMPYEEGMTDSLAKFKAENYDNRMDSYYQTENGSQLVGFVGALAAGFLDPVNYATGGLSRAGIGAVALTKGLAKKVATQNLARNMAKSSVLNKIKGYAASAGVNALEAGIDNAIYTAAIEPLYHEQFNEAYGYKSNLAYDTGVSFAVGATMSGLFHTTGKYFNRKSESRNALLSKTGELYKSHISTNPESVKSIVSLNDQIKSVKNDKNSSFDIDHASKIIDGSLDNISKSYRENGNVEYANTFDALVKSNKDKVIDAMKKNELSDLVESEFSKTIDKNLSSSVIKDSEIQIAKLKKALNKTPEGSEKHQSITNEIKQLEDSARVLKEKGPVAYTKKLTEQLSESRIVKEELNNLENQAMDLINQSPEDHLIDAKRLESVENGELNLHIPKSNEFVNEATGTFVKFHEKAYYNDVDFVKVKPALVKLEELIISHDKDGIINPEYPQELQPRDRSKKEAITDLINKSSNLNHNFLLDSPKASDGAPIVTSNGVVLSGNGRALILKMAKERNPAKFKAYLDTVRGIFGNSEDSIMVRVVDPSTPMSVIRSLTKESNISDALNLTQAEKAKIDASLITSKMIDDFNKDFKVGTLENEKFVNQFLQKLKPGEINDLRRDGKLTKLGEDRVKEAIFTKVFDDEIMTRRLFSDLKTENARVLKSLEYISPELLKHEYADINLLHGKIDIKTSLKNVYHSIVNAKDTDTALKTLLQQRNLYGDTDVPESLYKAFFKDSDFTQLRSEKDMKSILDNIMKHSLQEEHTMDLGLNEKPMSFNEIINKSIERHELSNPEVKEKVDIAKERLSESIKEDVRLAEQEKIHQEDLDNSIKSYIDCQY